MNKHDATIYLKGIKDFYGLDKDSEEAIDMAIEALSAEVVPHGRLIDADRLKSYIDCGHLRPPTEVCFSELDVCNMIDKAPTVSAEAVEVVRCGECKNRGSDACPMFFEEWFTIDEGDGYVDDDYRIHDHTESDGYCHWGERKGGDEE